MSTTIKFPLIETHECVHAMSMDWSYGHEDILNTLDPDLLDRLLFLDTYDIKRLAIVDDILQVYARYASVATAYGSGYRRMQRIPTWNIEHREHGEAVSKYTIETLMREKDEDFAALKNRAIQTMQTEDASLVTSIEDDGDGYGYAILTFDRTALERILFASIYTVKSWKIIEGCLELSLSYAGPETPDNKIRAFAWDMQLATGTSGVIHYTLTPIDR